MKRRPKLVLAGLLLAAFALGMGVGSRFGQRPVIYRDIPVPMPSAAAPEPAAPAASAAPTEGSPPACVDIRNAGSLVGKNGCVAGMVLRVYTSRSGNTFLDFCQNYRTCPFTSVIFASNMSKFGDLGSLQGKRVEIRGEVVTYQGHAEIVVRAPEQVKGP
jgi:hypothetical protein